MEKKQRLIDAEDLLQTLAAQFGSLDPRYVRGIDTMKGIEIAKKAIEAALTVDTAPVQQREWISVKDGLPDVDKTESRYETATVIVSTAAGIVRQMFYERTWLGGKIVRRWKWMWGGIYNGGEITHWMPLPEPPKEE